MRVEWKWRGQNYMGAFDRVFGRPSGPTALRHFLAEATILGDKTRRSVRSVSCSVKVLRMLWVRDTVAGTLHDRDSSANVCPDTTGASPKNWWRSNPAAVALRATAARLKVYFGRFELPRARRNSRSRFFKLCASKKLTRTWWRARRRISSRCQSRPSRSAIWWESLRDTTASKLRSRNGR
jgi:hypothetical protein